MTNAQIEALLKEDIKWAIDFGPGWDPSVGAEKKNGKWHRFSFTKRVECGGVCAIGALCVRRQPRVRKPPAWILNTERSREKKMFRDVASASAVLHRKFEWVLGLYWAVGWDTSRDWDDVRGRLSDAEKNEIANMAQRLRKFADAYEESDEHFLNEALVAAAFVSLP